MRMEAGDVTYPDPTPAGVILDKNVPVSMRDGIGIAVDVYKPAGMQGPWPAILAYSPCSLLHGRTMVVAPGL